MSDNSTGTGRHVETKDSGYIIAIAVGVSVTFVIAIAVLVYLLIVYLRARRVSRNVSIARSMHNTSTRSNDLIDQFGGPMWMSDLRDPNQETSTLSHEQGYNNIINAGYSENEKTREPSEPVYENTLRSATKFIAENTPEYDYLRQKNDRPNYSTIHHGYSGDGASNYDYPPHPHGAYGTSDYDYPKGHTNVNGGESPYDFPKGTGQNESPYDFPRGVPPVESPYDYPPNNAAVSREVENHPPHQASGYSGTQEQPTYANLRSPEESPYDLPPPVHREVSLKGRPSKRGLSKFNSPFAR